MSAVCTHMRACVCVCVDVCYAVMQPLRMLFIKYFLPDSLCDCFNAGPACYCWPNDLGSCCCSFNSWRLVQVLVCR